MKLVFVEQDHTTIRIKEFVYKTKHGIQIIVIIHFQCGMMEGVLDTCETWGLEGFFEKLKILHPREDLEEQTKNHQTLMTYVYEKDCIK